MARLKEPKKKPPKAMGIQDRVAKNAQALLLRREFVAGQPREIPAGLRPSQRQARQRSIARIKTPSQYATLAEREGRPDLDEAYYEKFLPPTAQLESVAARESVRQLEGVPTAREKAEGVITAKAAGYVQDTRTQRREIAGELSVAETVAINARRAIARQAQAVEEAARITGASGVEIAKITTSTPERRIQSIAADIGEREAGRNRFLQSVGVPVNEAGSPDLSALLNPMKATIEEGGSPGAFGIFGVKGDIAKAENAIGIYNRLVSDPTYGPEMKAWFEMQPEFQQFKQKIQSWGMSLYEPAPPIAQPNIPGVASSAGAGAPRRVFGY